jgi:hypothetical protein
LLDVVQPQDLQGSDNPALVAAATFDQFQQGAPHRIQRRRLAREIPGMLERDGLDLAAGAGPVVPQAQQNDDISPSAKTRGLGHWR